MRDEQCRWRIVDIVERFLAKIDQRGPDECWPWTAARDKDGYGIFWEQGRTVRAHRYSLELAIGPLPEGLEPCHSCDNPPCCNPNHLSAGTHQDNMDEMVERGRARGGRPLGS